MLIKVCETLGPLYKDNRMNSKIISKCCATCTVLEHFFCHKTPVTDVLKLDELRTLHDQMLQVSEALDVWGGLAAGCVSGHTLASPCPDTGLAAGASRVHIRTHCGNTVSVWAELEGLLQPEKRCVCCRMLVCRQEK